MARRRRQRGLGTVYPSEGGWIARFPLGVRDGRRVSKRVRCRTEREALAELERLHRAYGAGGDPATVTLDAYLTAWLRSHGRSVRASTLTSYRGHVRLHISPLLGGILVARLRPADIRRLIDRLERDGLSPATIGRVVTTLRAALQEAVDDRSLTDNPAAHVKLPRATEREPVHPLTRDEADAIRDAVAGHWTGPIVRLLLGSGLRLGEACALNRGDVLLDQGFVRLRKSKTTIRAVPVSADGIAALREVMGDGKPDDPVFTGNRNRKRLRGDAVTHALPRVLAAAGLEPLTPHALRHGAATLMLADGVPMRVIAEQLGHSSPALTARVYAHVLPEAQRLAVGSLDRQPGR